MPAIMDIPEVVEHNEHALYEEHYHHAAQPQGRVDRSGLWHRVLQYVKRHSAHTPHGTPSASHGSLHRMDTPADLLARESPSLYIRAYAGV